MRKLLMILFVACSTMVTAQITLDTKDATVDFKFLKDKTDGTVNDVKVSVSLNPADLANSKVSGTAKVASLATGNKTRDKHLKSKSFFEAETYPVMTFTSSEIVKEGDKYIAKGKLTIKEVTKEVAFEVTLSGESLEFTTMIYALDYDVSPAKKRENSQVEISVKVNAK